MLLAVVYDNRTRLSFIADTGGSLIMSIHLSNIPAGVSEKSLGSDVDTLRYERTVDWAINRIIRYIDEASHCDYETIKDDIEKRLSY